jgi:hypothetical protein
MPAAFCFRTSQVNLTGYFPNVLAVFTCDLHRGTLCRTDAVGDAHVNDPPVIDLPTCSLGTRAWWSMVLRRQALALNDMADT